MAVHIYLWLFFALLAFVPLFITNAISDRVPLPAAYWTAAWVWPISIAVLFLYAQRQCSGESVSLQDGLLWVTASMMTGWSTISFATIFPSLAAAFTASVAVALAGDLRQDPKYATQKWLLIVKFFYRHRMRQ